MASNSNYEANMARYRAAADAYANRQANAAAEQANQISAAAALAAARQGDQASRYVLDLERSRLTDKLKAMSAADPRRDPLMQDNSAYYASHPITRDSLGLGGDYYTGDQKRIMKNQSMADVVKQSAKSMRDMKNGFANRGMASTSPFIDQLVGKSYMDQARGMANAAAGVDSDVAKANVDWMTRGQDVVENQNAVVGASEAARQKAISDYMALLSSLV